MGAKVDKIEYEDLAFHERVGEGGFGAVKRVSFKKPYKGYKEAAAKSVFELGENEVKIMSQLNHPNIVTLLGFCRTGAADIIIMEYASNGSLHDYLSDQSKPLPYKLKKNWAKQSAVAIQYLHENNMLHRDIKPQNCLLFENNLLKLCDFGLARHIEHSQTTSSQKGTYRYMAPEIHKGNERGRAIYSKPADIYAYGMLVLEICTRKPPFDGMEWQTVILEVGNGAQPTIPEDCQQDLADIMQHCWNTDPRRRPAIEFIVEALSKWILENHIHPNHHGKQLQVAKVACCPNGNIVIANDRELYILSSDGHCKRSLTSPETHCDKRIQRITGIAVSLTGYILVIDDTAFVKVFDMTGKYHHYFKHKFGVFSSITTDKAGQILFADWLSNIITVHTCPDGRLENKVNCSIHLVDRRGRGRGLIVNSKNQIIHFRSRDSDHSTIVATDYSGNEVFTFTTTIDNVVTYESTLIRARGLVCDADDNIYIALAATRMSSLGIIPIPATGHIHMYSPTGSFLQCIAKGLESPQDLSITPDGSLIVATGESILIYSK